MLLSFFKPELADTPDHEVMQVVSRTVSTFDPLSQSANEEVEYSFRVIASPAPTTEDLVAGTAAVLRAAGRSLLQATGEPISHLALGIPSLSPLANKDEFNRAVARRDEALKLAEFANDYGENGMTVAFYPEAFAAARGIDPHFYTGCKFLVMIDVGAGTTDFSLTTLLPHADGESSIGEEILAHSHRFAGRDLNAVMASWLGSGNSGLRKAMKTLDGRAWQVMLDREMERAKRALSAGDPSCTVRLSDIATTSDILHADALQAQALRQVVICDLTLGKEDLDWLLERAVLHSRFDKSLDGFLDTVTAAVPDREAERTAVVLVGGGFLFPPFRKYIERRVHQLLGTDVRIRFQPSESHLQTTVALGLARAAALRAGA